MVEAAKTTEPGPAGGSGQGRNGRGARPEAVTSGGSPVGVMLVPPREAGAEGVVLPQDYRDILEVVGDAGRPLRAGHIAAALGISQDRSTVESLRAKLKRLSARGWLDEVTAGLFWSRCGPVAGKRQLEELVARAAVDIDAFYAAKIPVPAPTETLLVLSVDAKGIVMRPGGLREATAHAAARGYRVPDQARLG